jgi:hypothetical protein
MKALYVVRSRPVPTSDLVFPDRVLEKVKDAWPRCGRSSFG